MEVPVHQARGMDDGQAFRQPAGQRQQGPGGHRPVLADRLGQRGPVDVRRRQPRHVAVQIRVDHGGDEGSADLPRGGDLGPEPGIPGQFGPDDLHRDGFPARRTAQVHRAQPAAGQLPEQLVRPDRAHVVRRKWRYHPESPLLVAVTAILTRSVKVSILRNGYEPVYARAPQKLTGRGSAIMLARRRRGTGRQRQRDQGLRRHVQPGRQPVANPGKAGWVPPGGQAHPAFPMLLLKPFFYLT